MTTILPLHGRPCLVEVMSLDNEKKFVIPRVGTLIRINAADPNGLLPIGSNEPMYQGNVDQKDDHWA